MNRVFLTPEAEQEELGPALHSFPVDAYIVFYRSARGGIEVVRVLHGARDIPGQF